MTTHTHKAGMTYYTHPAYINDTADVEYRLMHLFAAWDDVTNQGRGVLVAGYDPRCPAAMKPILPGTRFVIPKAIRDLAEAGSALMAARQSERDALDDAKRVALRALKAGVTEVDVARSLGVDRMTVRKWQGKGRRDAD